MARMWTTSLDLPALLRFIGFAVGGGLGMYWGIGLAFEWLYYRRRSEAQAWKCQPKRWPSPSARRREILLGSVNMTVGSIASGFFVYYVAKGGYTTLYFSLEQHGLAHAIGTGLVYVFGTDLALYLAHRMFHTPRLYKLVHKVHHRWVSPTVFTAAAMHPVEWVTYQSIMAIPLFFLPVHVGAVIATLLFTNYYALVDHSGVKLHSYFPFIAPTAFHDDHHAHFHVNYGQTFPLWDRVFGTMRRKNRKYGPAVFGGGGEGGGASDEVWDYSPKAAAAAAPPVEERA